MKYDILIFNNSTKKDYLYQGQEDASTSPLYHTFENLDLSGLPSGEYTVYTVRNEYGTEVKWEISDVPLNSILEYDSKQYLLRDLKPEINLMKIGTEATEDKSEYKKTDVFYQYRKRN